MYIALLDVDQHAVASQCSAFVHLKWVAECHILVAQLIIVYEHMNPFGFM